MLPKTSSGRWLAGMAGGVVALVVLAIVVSLITNAGEPDILPEGTPEGTVQQFLLALQDGDTPLAYTLLSAEITDRCSLDQFEDHTRFMTREQRGQVHLEGVREFSAGTEVTVGVTHVNTSFPFDADRTTTFRYVLVEEEGEWRLTYVEWPYIGCRFLTPAPTATVVPTPMSPEA